MTNEKNGVEHPLVTKVVGEPDGNTSVTVVKGYAGRSVANGFMRIYRAKDFDAYFHVALADVVHREDHDEPLAPSTFWIRSSAQLTLSSRSEEAIAKGAAFLAGEIAERAIADWRADSRGGADLAPPPTQSTLRICKSITLECASEYCGKW